jgi:uroporphyrinogen-III synthase
VVVTRAEGPEGPLASALAEGGARVLPLPTVAFALPEDPGALEASFGRLAEFDWLLVTSPHAAAVLTSHPAWAAVGAGGDRPHVAAAGTATAERLAEAGAVVDLAPAEAGARGLLESFARAGTALAGTRMLWPRSDIARRDLADGLRGQGATVEEVVAYRTLPARGPAIATFLRHLEKGRIDAVTFMSPSSAENLARALGGGDLRRLADRTLVASIGPTTSEALRRLGAPPQAEALSRTAAGLAAAVLDRLRARNGVLR